MLKEEFTVQDGITIQTNQLNKWKTILIPEVYEALEEYAKRNNDKAKTGYDICRGGDLDNYIGNYMLGYRF
jgi:hypothetical protein